MYQHFEHLQQALNVNVHASEILLNLVSANACNFTDTQAKIICSNTTVIENSINKVVIVR